MLAAYWSDFRFSARQLLRAPAFSFFAIILIALSLGSVTSIFTVIDTIFLRKLPAHNADQLVAITTVDTSEPVVSTAWPDGLSYPAYREIRAGQRVFSDVFAWTDGSLHNIEANGVLELADVMAATGNYATALGISPLLGRTLLPRDSNFSSEPAAVLSYECWKRVFGGARDVLGKSIRIEGTPYAIVGVMPPRFALRLGIPPDVTVSLEALMSALHVSLSDPKSTRFQVTGRLKVGVSLQEARAQLHTLWPLILDSLGDPYRDPKSVKSDRELRVSSFSRGYTSLRDRLATPLLILLLISGLVLLVGCANVATLMLARVSKRHQELGIRMALGASRSALIRLPLADGILICVVGALMGLLLATGLSRGLLGFIWTAAFPMVIEAMPSQAVLLLTAGLALITVLLTSIVPTYWLASHSPAVALAEVRGSGTSLRQFNVGRVLVTGQVALSLILASAAVLFVTDLVTLQRNRTGLNSKDVLVEWLNLKPGAEKVSTEALVSELTSLPSHVEAMPGVSSAGIFSGAVFTPYELFQPVFPTTDPTRRLRSHWYVIGPHFLPTIGMTIMHGRDFNAQDRGDSHLVAIISASLASSLFGNGPAVGQHLSLGNDSRHSDLEVVGVVNDANFQNLHEPNPLAVFTLLFQEAAAYLHSPQLAVRTQSDPASVSAPLRRVIESDTQYYPWRTEKLSALIDKEIITERLVTSVSVYFALPAVLLASVALYGLIAYTVISRAREIGIRMALGANRNKILFWMWIQAARPVAVGLLIGVLAATMMRHIFSAQISPLLKGASANDFAIISSATILMALVAALACFIPAWKATLINPVETLKQV